MGFIEEYKRLEKLCGEILNDERRVSAYIDEMTNTPQGAYFVNGWEEDLKQLKHYRWIRNQIVHEPSCSEENMCNGNDIQWIVDFHSRIMNRTDPLALYRKVVLNRHKQATKSAAVKQYQQQSCNDYHETPIHWGCLIAILIVTAAMVVVLLLLYKIISPYLSVMFSRFAAFIADILNR